MKPPRVNVKKVGNFLKSLSQIDFMYLTTTLQLANAIQELIRVHELTKEDFCKRFEIKPEKYKDYIKGNYNYSVHDIAALNANSMELDMERRARMRTVKLEPSK